MSTELVDRVMRYCDGFDEQQSHEQPEDWRQIIIESRAAEAHIASIMKEQPHPSRKKDFTLAVEIKLDEAQVQQIVDLARQAGMRVEPPRNDIQPPSFRNMERKNTAGFSYTMK